MRIEVEKPGRKSRSQNPAFQTPKTRDSRKIQLSRLSECETLAKSSFPDAQNACLFRNPLSGRLRNGGDPSRSKKVAQTELPESLSIRVRAHVFFSRNFRIQFDSRFDSRFDSFQTRKMRDSLKIQLSRRPKRETLAKSSFSDAQNARLFQNLAFQTPKMRDSRKIQLSRRPNCETLSKYTTNTLSTWLQFFQ